MTPIEIALAASGVLAWLFCIGGLLWFEQRENAL